MKYYHNAINRDARLEKRITNAIKRLKSFGRSDSDLCDILVAWMNWMTARFLQKGEVERSAD